MSNLLIDFSRQIAISFFSGKFLKSSCLVAFFFFFLHISLLFYRKHPYSWLSVP